MEYHKFISNLRKNAMIPLNLDNYYYFIQLYPQFHDLSNS